MTAAEHNGEIDTDHLNGFDCERCGHSTLAHYRNPACRNCRCSADPVCWCGRLTSKHGTPTPPASSVQPVRVHPGGPRPYPPGERTS